MDVAAPRDWFEARYPLLWSCEGEGCEPWLFGALPVILQPLSLPLRQVAPRSGPGPVLQLKRTRHGWLNLEMEDFLEGFKDMEEMPAGSGNVIYRGRYLEVGEMRRRSTLCLEIVQTTS